MHQTGIPRTLILGIGNILWADEGFGVRMIEHLSDRWKFDETVTLLDGGTQGLYLLPYLENADRLLVFDAVDYGLQPGTIKTVANEKVPQFLTAKKMSLHQTGFQEVIATATLIGYCPEDMFLIGVQPEELDDFGGGLRPIVAQQMQKAESLALEWLNSRGVYAQTGNANGAQTAHSSITRDAFEAGRPSERVAFRKGDLRFL